MNNLKWDLIKWKSAPTDVGTRLCHVSHPPERVVAFFIILYLQILHLQLWDIEHWHLECEADRSNLLPWLHGCRSFEGNSRNQSVLLAPYELPYYPFSLILDHFMLRSLTLHSFRNLKSARRGILGECELGCQCSSYFVLRARRFDFEGEL